MLARVLAGSEAESRARRMVRCLMLATAGAGLTAVGAQVTIPWWPVPATLQVFFVLVCGAALGAKWGAVAQAQYVAAGALGMPVFAGGASGPAVLVGPTGGYLFGFIVAAYVTGWLKDILGSRGWRPYAATLAGAGAIWMCGWAWLAVWAAAVEEATPVGWAFIGGVAPFIAIDALKAGAAAAVARPLVSGTGEPKR